MNYPSEQSKTYAGIEPAYVLCAFCLLLGGSTIVQLPLAKYKILDDFSPSKYTYPRYYVLR